MYISTLEDWREYMPVWREGGKEAEKKRIRREEEKGGEERKGLRADEALSTVSE